MVQSTIDGQAILKGDKIALSKIMNSGLLNRML
jgi:hypothetical protein